MKPNLNKFSNDMKSSALSEQERRRQLARLPFKDKLLAVISLLKMRNKMRLARKEQQAEANQVGAS